MSPEPNRHQWTERELDIAQGVRTMLPPRYRRDPLALENELPLRPLPHSVVDMIQRDPTEAADSENIIPAVRRNFPDAEIILTGGAIYHLALNNVIAHFTEDDDLALLHSLLAADHAFADVEGISHYAVAIARK